ncbi:MAG: glycosyltransferase family 39 protein [Nibricoccus sp.]
MRIVWKKLFVLGLISLAVLLCRFVFISKANAASITIYWGYWIMLAGACIYLGVFWRFFKGKSIVRILVRHRLGIVAALLGTIFLQVHEPHRFKVLYDEFTISGVARSMHYTRTAVFPTRAHNLQNELLVMDVAIDKRPLFFQLILATIHDLTGYRPSNVFALNAGATFLLLLLTYWLAQKWINWQAGIFAVACWLTLPLLAQASTSAGYDVFNLAMMMLLLYFSATYLRDGGVVNQSLLILTAVHLAQVRYESILFVIPTALVIILRWWRSKELELGWIGVFAPIFLLLPLLINLIFVETKAFHQTVEGQNYFDVINLVGNAERAVFYLFNVNLRVTNSVFLAAAGIVALIFFYVRSFRNWRELGRSGEDIVVLMMSVVVVGNFGLILCNFWGQLDDPTASRFSLPFHLLLILAILFIVREIRRFKAFPSYWYMIVAFPLAFAASISAWGSATTTLWQGNEMDWLFSVLREPQHRGALVIAHPVGPILYNYPSVSLPTAERDKWKISECLKGNFYPEILVLERFTLNLQTMEEVPYGVDRIYDIKKDKLTGDNMTALSGAFRREKVAEIRSRPNVITRISRITGVDEESARRPEPFSKAGPPFKGLNEYNQYIYDSLP